MWRTDLAFSYRQLFIISLFYCLLLTTVIFALNDTYLDDYIFVLVIVVVIEWWRAGSACKLIKGELALFYDINELYWLRQRWLITKSPLFLRYAVVLQLAAKRNGKKRVLFIINDSFSRQDWRSFNYFLRQFVNI